MPELEQIVSWIPWTIHFIGQVGFLCYLINPSFFEERYTRKQLAITLALTQTPAALAGGYVIIEYLVNYLAK